MPEFRQMIYATEFGTGGRIGEIVALRVRDYEPDAQPLPRITIRRARKSVSRRIGPTKTGAVKIVPVHPELKVRLDGWLATGWAKVMGRAPGPDDLLFPTKDNTTRDVSHQNDDLRGDCERLGIPVRHQHAMRHTFITLAQDDGADGTVLRWVTHAPPRSAFDAYTRGPWLRLCAEVAKLNITLTPAASTNGSGGGGDGSKSSSTSITRDETRDESGMSKIILWNQQDNESGREDLKVA